MKADQAAQLTYLIGGNKTPLPSTGTKYDKIIQLLNLKQSEWAHSLGVEWDSLFDIVPLGKVTTAPNYQVDSSINHITKESDPVVITHVTGQTTEYEFVNPRDFAQRPKQNTCTIRQGNLVFSDQFTNTSPQYGGQITAPAILQVGTITKPTDSVVVDNPMWLCYAAGAEYARGVTAKTAQLGNIQAYADNLLAEMIQNNGGQRTDFDREPTALGESWHGREVWYGR